MTRLLDELRAEIRHLTGVYLPATPSVLPAPEDQERARAFVLFCHAEIEWYIEQAAETYLASIRDAASGGVFNFSSLALVAFSEAKLPVGEALGGKKDGRSVATIFEKLESDLKVVIASNNGIREKNLAKFLGPLGLTGKIDSTWLGDLESLASLRGRFAHMSGGTRATVASINPEDMRKLCVRIVEGDGVLGRTQISSIKDLDEAFERWKGELAPQVKTEMSLFKRIFGR